MFPTSQGALDAFRFSLHDLRKHGGTVSNLCSARRENVVEKVSPPSRTTKILFLSVLPFSSRGNKHIFSFYPSTLEIAELCFETTASHSTIICSRSPYGLLSEALGFFGFLPFRGAGTGLACEAQTQKRRPEMRLRFAG